MLEEVGGAQRRRVEAASHAVELSTQGHGDPRSWACAEGGKCFAAHHRLRLQRRLAPPKFVLVAELLRANGRSEAAPRGTSDRAGLRIVATVLRNVLHLLPSRAGRQRRPSTMLEEVGGA